MRHGLIKESYLRLEDGWTIRVTKERLPQFDPSLFQVGGTVRTGNGQYGTLTEHDPNFDAGLDGWGVDTGGPDGKVWWHATLDLEPIS